MAALLLLAVAAIVLLAVRRPGPSAPRVASAPEATSQPLPYDSLVFLAARVKSLQSERRYVESLAGARALLRQHELHGRLVAEMVTDYARMLNNAAFEGDDHPPRSSFERIDFERQALGGCQRALTLARTPRQRSEVIMMVGLVHEVWGFPYDAYLAYRAATEADPTYAEARRHQNMFMRRFSPAGTRVDATAPAGTP